MIISGFNGIYRFLSNFYNCTVNYDGIVFDSVEKAYQYAKCYKDYDKIKIVESSSAREAKSIGRQIKLRNDWEHVKLPIMLNLVTQKFSTPILKQALLNTGDAIIIERNWWHDNFWGDCTCTRCKTSIGYNHLGEILMQVRFTLANNK